MYLLKKDDKNLINIKSKLNDLQNNHNLMINKIKSNESNESNNQRNHQKIIVNRDQELIHNQLLPPVRRNHYIEGSHYISNNPVEVVHHTKGIPINIPTRGYEGQFQQIGMLHREAVSNENQQIGNNSEINILPLYGKPLYSNSSKWLYYTSSDKFNSLKIPINYKGKDCTDDYGCDQIYDDDIIDIPSYNGKFKTKIYKFDKPRYIPI